MTTRALLRVNLRGAFFRTKKYTPAVNFCKTVNQILEENIMDKNYKPITSMKEVPEQLIIPGLFEPPVRTLRATIPENESHIFR